MVTLVDTSVLLDIATEDITWAEWSFAMLRSEAQVSHLAINPIIYAELSFSYDKIEDVEWVVPDTLYKRFPIPFEAAFLAAKAHRNYRRRGGKRITTLPDFFVGAHAAVSGFRILTRDARRFRQYFPSVELLAP